MHAAYDELKKTYIYEGRTAAGFCALLDSITNISHGDRKSSIEEHVAYDRTWNSL